MKKCIKNVNDIDWIDDCSKVCDKFDILEWNNFFIPHFKKYKNII